MWMSHKPFAIHRSHRASVIRMSKSIKGINSTHVEYNFSSHAFYNIYLTHHLVSEVVKIISNFQAINLTFQKHMFLIMIYVLACLQLGDRLHNLAV